MYVHFICLYQFVTERNALFKLRPPAQPIADLLSKSQSAVICLSVCAVARTQLTPAKLGS